MIGKRDVFVPVRLLGDPGAVVRVDGDGEVVVSRAVVDDDQETVFGVDGAEGAVGDVVGADGCGGGRGWGRGVEDVLFVDDAADDGAGGELVSVEGVVVEEAGVGHAGLVAASGEGAGCAAGRGDQGAAD